jgi:hypothetical protein
MLHPVALIAFILRGGLRLSLRLLDTGGRGWLLANLWLLDRWRAGTLLSTRGYGSTDESKSSDREYKNALFHRECSFCLRAERAIYEGFE